MLFSVCSMWRRRKVKELATELCVICSVLTWHTHLNPFTPNRLTYISSGKCWFFSVKVLRGLFLPFGRTAPYGMNSLALLTYSAYFWATRLQVKRQKLMVKNHWHEWKAFTKLQVIAGCVNRGLTCTESV